ncbi:MAG: preprotein translocase subunit SecG [Moraxellaceae bacterium]
MESAILVFHVLFAIAMIGFILLQQGKGAEMGASFGAGASQTVFGAAGSAGFLTKATAVLAALFFVTSLGLAIYAKKNAQGFGLVPEVSAEHADAKPAGDVPVVPATSAAAPAASGDVPAAPAQ